MVGCVVSGADEREADRVGSSEESRSLGLGAPDRHPHALRCRSLPRSITQTQLDIMVSLFFCLSPSIRRCSEVPPCGLRPSRARLPGLAHPLTHARLTTLLVVQQGAACGKESHFQGEGQTLGSSQPSSSHPTSKQPAAKAAPTPAAASAGHTLGSSSSSGPPSADETARREALARAAEARNASTKSRGTPNAGGIARKLDGMGRDGGRREEAIREGEGRGEPLVVSLSPCGLERWHLKD